MPQRIRAPDETTKDYARRKAKENYNNDPEYRAKMLLKCWKKKYPDHKAYQTILHNPDIPPTEMLKQTKRYDCMYKLQQL